MAAAEEQVELLALQDSAIRSALAEGGFVSGNGVKDVAALCGESEDPRCQPSGWSEGLLTRDAVWVMRTVAEQWPNVAEVGGYRASDPYPDHPSGRAVDVMVPADHGRVQANVTARQIMRRPPMTGAAVIDCCWRNRRRAA